MITASGEWADFLDPMKTVRPGRDRGTIVVWRCEVSKLSRQVRVWIAAGLCLTVPFLAAGAFVVQSALPQDTLFGQWIHSSGFALPLVILGFTGQWVLPLLTSVVAGDIFASEDHFRTWKTLLTSSRSRGQIFLGKLAAAVTYSLAMLLMLAGSSFLAGLTLGTRPLVNLSGQPVPGGRAGTLVVASWATQIAPLLGFCALAVLLSISTRSPVMGIGGPVLIGLVMQLGTLINLPTTARAGLLATPFLSWHGLWVDPAFYGPLRQGLVTSVVWFAACADIAWVIFRYRSIAVS